MSPYKVKASNRDIWKGQSSCILNISMKQKYHEDGKFVSILEWAGQTFDSCIINVCDTLHRHNLLAQYGSPERAHSEALKLGDDWLKRNGDAIAEHMNIPYELKRWDYWIAQPEFKKLYEYIVDYYKADQMFKAAIEKDTRYFVMRQKDQKDIVHNLEDYKKASRLYLLEEAAVYILMGRIHKIAKAYPAPELDSIAYLRKDTTPSHLKGLELSFHINLNFKKRRSATRKAA